MISAMRVGREAMLLCIHKKLAKALCTPLLRATCPLVLADRACCIVLKMLWDPSSANAMDLSLPRMECHFLSLMQRWVDGMEARISASQSTRWGGQLDCHVDGVDDPAQYQFKKPTEDTSNVIFEITLELVQDISVII